MATKTGKKVGEVIIGVIGAGLLGTFVGTAFNFTGLSLTIATLLPALFMLGILIKTLDF